MAETTLDTVAPGTRRSSKDKILSRLADLRKSDPKLYEAMRLMVDDLDKVTLQLNPVVEAAAEFRATQEIPPPVINFTYAFSTSSVNLAWDRPDPVGSTMFYEIREGASWAVGDFILRTPSLSAALPPLAIGSYTYWIKTLNAIGDESTDAKSLAVTVPNLGTPSVSALVIDNNVLLSWAEPSSTFTVDYYEVLKDGTPVGTLSGTWFNLFESISGSYVYGIKAYDIVGNASAEGQVSAEVDQPPDFELLVSADIPLETGASLTNMYYEAADSKVYGPADLTETFEDHFTSEGWADPQDQIDAAMSLFIQENPDPGTWQGAEQDLGADKANVIANFTYVAETLPTTDAPSYVVYIMGSTQAEGPLGGAWVAGASQYFAAVRYLAFRIVVTPDASEDSMCKIHNCAFSVDIKYVIDGNVIVCDGTDVGGTQVDLPGVVADGHGTKTFADIDSITLAPIETDNQAITAIYDFVDAPNPTDFKILCFDNAGKRVDATVSWKVHGIKA